jgi:hypothetical protein
MAHLVDNSMLKTGHFFFKSDGVAIAFLFLYYQEFGQK